MLRTLYYIGIDEVLPPQPSPEIFSEEATEASEAAEEDDLGGGKEVSYTSSSRPHTLVA